MARAMINPDMIRWARERADLSLAELAGKMKQPEDRLARWEDGEEQPTFKQAQDIAHKTYQPFGYLFLQQPPQEDDLLPDLRTIGDAPVPEFSVNLRDTVHGTMARQDWYRDYLKEQGAETLDFVNAASLENDTPEQTARRIKERLGLPARPTKGNSDDYLRTLVQHIEDIGVLVMRNSMVGNNNHRLLDISEFRGFAVADEYAPVIFINTQDAPQARLFTLIHELAHIWLGQSGVSDANPQTTREVERFCNRVAAEFLAPADEFSQLWKGDPNRDWREQVPELAKHFHVSYWVIARRALELGLINDGDYWPYVQKIQQAYNDSKKNQDGPVPQGMLQKQRVSPRFAEALTSETLSGRVLYRDAWRLIGVKPARLRQFAEKELQR